MPINIQIGEVLTNAELSEKFGVANSGGMRRSIANNLLILIHHTDSIYHDRWENDILYYTGMGLTGNQSITYKQNKTLAESATNGVTILLFYSPKSNQYIFKGEVILASSPYFETQVDENNHSRSVVIFPLKLK